LTEVQESSPNGEASEGERYESVLAESSREMVRIYKEQFGRGPTKARTDFAGPDIVISTLEHSFTPAEQRLAEMGEHQRLRDTRMYFQYASEETFREAIERTRSGPSSAASTPRRTSPRRSSTSSRGAGWRGSEGPAAQARASTMLSMPAAASWRASAAAGCSSQR
jgi:hypothetical protein